MWEILRHNKTNEIHLTKYEQSEMFGANTTTGHLSLSTNNKNLLFVNAYNYEKVHVYTFCDIGKHIEYDD